MLNNPDRWWMQTLEQNNRDCWNDWNQDRELTARRKGRQTDKGMKWGRWWWMQGGWWGRPARARPIVEARKKWQQEKGGKKERHNSEKRVVKMTAERGERDAWMLVSFVPGPDGPRAARMMGIWITDCLLGGKKEIGTKTACRLSQDRQRREVYTEKSQGSIDNDKRGQKAHIIRETEEVRRCSKSEKRRS